MDASNTVTEFSLCQLPGKAYEKDLVTTVVSSLPASLMLDRFGKTKPESGAFLDIILKETVLFAEGGVFILLSSRAYLTQAVRANEQQVLRAISLKPTFHPSSRALRNMGCDCATTLPPTPASPLFSKPTFSIPAPFHRRRRPAVRLRYYGDPRRRWSALRGDPA